MEKKECNENKQSFDKWDIFCPFNPKPIEGKKRKEIKKVEETTNQRTRENKKKSRNNSSNHFLYI